MRRTVVWLAALLIAGCPSPSPVNDAGADAGGGASTCKATLMPTSLVDDFRSGTRSEATYVTEEIVPPSLVNDDLYWIDTSAGGLAANGNFNNGVIKHLKLDGSALSTVVQPTGYLFQVFAADTDLFYLQEDQISSSPKAFEVHLYRTPRAAPQPGTKVGTAAIQIGHEGLFLPNCGAPCGIFASRGDEVFINAVGELDRVTLSTGQLTVIAKSSGPSPHSLWGALLDANTVIYQEGDGAVFSTPANATGPSGTRLGTATCGSDVLNLASMRRTASGFLCSDRDAISSVDAAFGAKHAVFASQQLEPAISTFTPSPAWGTTFFAMPEYVVQDWDKTSSIYRVDTDGGAPAPVVCNVHSVVWSALGPTQVVYVEARTDATHTKFFSVRTVPR